MHTASFFHQIFYSIIITFSPYLIKNIQPLSQNSHSISQLWNLSKCYTFSIKSPILLSMFIHTKSIRCTNTRVLVTFFSNFRFVYLKTDHNCLFELSFPILVLYFFFSPFRKTTLLWSTHKLIVAATYPACFIYTLFFRW